MSCYYPLRAWRAKSPNPSGKYGLTFKRSEAQQDEELNIACGNCIGCRLERSKVWAIRCQHEASCHPFNCFITLTYDDEHLPDDGSLVKKHFTQFMKNLRKRVAPSNIRFYMCGEYGQDQALAAEGIEAIGRPHYHAILFNINPIEQADPYNGSLGVMYEDKKILKSKQKPTSKFGIVGRVENSPSGEKQYLSTVIQKAWGKGRTRVSPMSFEAAAYVARYCTKKLNPGNTPESEQAFFDRYSKLNPETGEVNLVEPEYTNMSRNGGIGSLWFEKYKNDLGKGYLTVNGVEMSIPSYYESLLEKDMDNADMIDNIKEKKREFLSSNTDKYEADRLRVAERIKRKQLKQLKREL